jgi:hypothetical protein
MSGETVKESGFTSAETREAIASGTTITASSNKVFFVIFPLFLFDMLVSLLTKAARR